MCLFILKCENWGQPGVQPKFMEAVDGPWTPPLQTLLVRLVVRWPDRPFEISSFCWRKPYYFTFNTYIRWICRSFDVSQLKLTVVGNSMSWISFVRIISLSSTCWTSFTSTSPWSSKGICSWHIPQQFWDCGKCLLTNTTSYYNWRLKPMQLSQTNKHIYFRKHRHIFTESTP